MGSASLKRFVKYDLMVSRMKVSGSVKILVIYSLISLEYIHSDGIKEERVVL